MARGVIGESGDFGERMMGPLYVIRFQYGFQYGFHMDFMGFHGISYGFHMDFMGVDIWILWDVMGFLADLC